MITATYNDRNGNFIKHQFASIELLVAAVKRAGATQVSFICEKPLVDDSPRERTTA